MGFTGNKKIKGSWHKSPSWNDPMPLPITDSSLDSETLVKRWLLSFPLNGLSVILPLTTFLTLSASHNTSWNGFQTAPSRPLWLFARLTSDRRSYPSASNTP